MILRIDSNLTITTSRKPSQITRRFAQFLKHYFDAVYINRGKSNFNKIINQLRMNNKTKLLVITETKGNPSSVNLYDIEMDVKKPQVSIFLNVSLPHNNKKINVDSENIVFINKAKTLNEINNLFIPYETREKIKTNCIISRDYDDENIIAIITFFDKKGIDTKYKLYIKEYKINKLSG